MFLLTALLLGFSLGSSGLLSNRINSKIGLGIANKNVHAYLTFLGAMSNQIIPIVAVIAGMFLYGIVQGLLIAVCLLFGSFLAGFIIYKMKPPLDYLFLLFNSLVGVPLTSFLYVFTIV